MSGPLAGIGSGQVQPQINTFQPGRGNEVRQEQDQRQQSNEATQGQGSNGVQDINTSGRAENTAPVRAAVDSAPNTDIASNEGRRGGIVNISV